MSQPPAHADGEGTAGLALHRRAAAPGKDKGAPSAQAQERREAVERTLRFIGTRISLPQLSAASQVDMVPLKRILAQFAKEGLVELNGPFVQGRF